jgi:hypothetical protein
MFLFMGVHTRAATDMPTSRDVYHIIPRPVYMLVLSVQIHLQILFYFCLQIRQLIAVNTKRTT